jgi:GR25 family glycosyltransferase involved in LPS biosynthesis
MKLFYINLEFRKDRKQFMENQLSTFQKISYKHLNAINPSIQYLNQLLKDNYLNINNYYKILTNQSNFITKGSVGCFMSHLELLKKCIEDQEIFIILEDDVIISNEFEITIMNILNSINDFDMIYLEQPLDVWKETAIDYNNYLYKIDKGYFGTFAYIIHPNHANFLIQHLKTIDNHIDNLYLHYNQNKKIFLAKSKICSTDYSNFRDSNVKIIKKKLISQLLIPLHLYINLDETKLILEWKKIIPNLMIYDINQDLSDKSGFFVYNKIYPKINFLNILNNIKKFNFENDSSFYAIYKTNDIINENETLILTQEFFSFIFNKDL